MSNFTKHKMYELQKNLSTEELINALSTIPTDVTELSLEFMDLGDRTTKDLIAIFNAIPNANEFSVFTRQ